MFICSLMPAECTGYCSGAGTGQFDDCISKLDLAFNNVKPKDWYFVLDMVSEQTAIWWWPM